MDTPESIAKRLDIDVKHSIVDQWEVVDFATEDDQIRVWAEEAETGDEVSFLITVSRVEFSPGPPRPEDFAPDRLEPEDG